MEKIKLIPKIIRDLFQKPSPQDYLEEALFAFAEDYSGFIQNFINIWKEQIHEYGSYIEGGYEVVEKFKSDLTTKFEFWDTITRDMTNAFVKI